MMGACWPIGAETVVIIGPACVTPPGIGPATGDEMTVVTGLPGVALPGVIAVTGW